MKNIGKSGESGIADQELLYQTKKKEKRAAELFKKACYS